MKKVQFEVKGPTKGQGARKMRQKRFGRKGREERFAEDRQSNIDRAQSSMDYYSSDEYGDPLPEYDLPPEYYDYARIQQTEYPEEYLTYLARAGRAAPGERGMTTKDKKAYEAYQKLMETPKYKLSTIRDLKFDIAKNTKELMKDGAKRSDMGSTLVVDLTKDLIPGEVAGGYEDAKPEETKEPETVEETDYETLFSDRVKEEPKPVKEETKTVEKEPLVLPYPNLDSLSYGQALELFSSVPYPEMTANDKEYAGLSYEIAKLKNEIAQIAYDTGYQEKVNKHNQSQSLMMTSSGQFHQPDPINFMEMVEIQDRLAPLQTKIKQLEKQQDRIIREGIGLPTEEEAIQKTLDDIINIQQERADD